MGGVGDLTPGAVEHLVPVVEILIGVVVLAAALMGGLWRGFSWLDSQMTKKFHILIAEFTQANDRRHDLHDRAIKDLRDRDNERAEAIKRLHGRVDGILERSARHG